MKEYEYFDLGADVFMKVHEGGDIVESLKKPKSEWPNVVINRFNGRKSYIITEEEQNEDMETVEAMAANGDETKTYDIANTDNLIVTENEEPDPVFVEPVNNNKSLKEESTKRYILPEEPIDIIYNPDKNFDPEKLGLQVIEDDKPKKESKKKKSKKEGYDFVSHPNHYNGHKLLAKLDNDEKVEVIYETIDFLDSTARRMEKVMYGDELHSYLDTGKYYDRAGEKPEEGKTVRYKMWEDIKKQIWYLSHCADLIEKNGFEDKK